MKTVAAPQDLPARQNSAGAKRKVACKQTLCRFAAELKRQAHITSSALDCDDEWGGD